MQQLKTFKSDFIHLGQNVDPEPQMALIISNAHRQV